MRRPALFRKFALVLFSLAAFSVYAESVDNGEAARAAEARAWLNKIQSAAQRLSYSGTFVYQQGSQFRTSRITHMLSGKNELEKLEILDGEPREYIRNNDEVICYVPQDKTVLVEKRVTRDVFPGILAASPASLAAHYTISKAETGRIAGYECQAILLQPKDNLRYGYKLWAEKKSGLLLRAQTLGEHNEVIEQIAFAHISIGNVDRKSLAPTYTDTRGWQVENALMSPADLSAWTVKNLPAGFKRTRELKRVLSDAGAEGNSNTAAQQREVGQIVFSDGLAAISVFIEPGTKSRTEGWMQQGALNIVGKRQGDFWLTIVGEVPSAAIRQVANSIELKQ